MGEEKKARWEKIGTPSNIQPKSDEDRGLATITRTISFITPMFGGGVKTEGHPCDDVTPVRVSSIRGQLRFWWRAAVGSGKETVAAMREEEGRLFGCTPYKKGDNTAGGRAAVEIQIKHNSNVKDIAVNDYAEKVTAQKDAAEKKAVTAAFNYSTFALKRDKLHDIAGSFNLIVKCPKGDKGNIELALECWLAFGGLGGRTRRGFGALRGGEWKLDKIFEKIRNKQVRMNNVPSLIGSTYRIQEPGNPKEAHGYGLKKLKVFRQEALRIPNGRSSPFGRNPGNGNHPGRSQWPEPDAIRRFVGRNAFGRHSPEHRSGNVFPRACFGMPIIFQFAPKDKQADNLGEPKKTELLPEGKTRMASPLILKPYVSPDGKTYSLALVLGNFVLPEVVLMLKTNTVTREVRQFIRESEGKQFIGVKCTLNEESAGNIAAMANSDARAQTDPIAAFLDYFSRKN